MARTERGLGKRDLSMIFTEITPPHGWKQDQDFHYLRLTLPGFEANDVTIHMDKYGHLVVRGNKQVTEHKYVSFEETYEIPSDAKLDDAMGLFEDNQIYCVTIPKVKGQQQHAITMPKEHKINPKPRDNASIHQYDDNNNNNNDRNNNVEKPEVPAPESTRPRKDYLKIVRGDKSAMMKIALYIAALIALTGITVLIILKLRS